MNNGIGTRMRKAWNAFFDKKDSAYQNGYGGSYYRPDRTRLTRGNERSIITSIINKIALDVASIKINHCRLDDDDRYKEVIQSDLNNCLSLEANIDQTSRAFIQDAVMSMLDDGVVALVPIDTSANPDENGCYSIYTMRTGKIIGWYPDTIRVDVYNDRTGRREQITVSKKNAAIIENPLFSVMNEPNSTLQRLIRKLNLLDVIDEQSGSGKLDLIIQLPYVIKSQARKNQAEERRKEIEKQLTGSKYGIAYTDGTEKITQLNRAVENNLMKQIEYLTSMLYGQLGISQTVLDGTADDTTMNNYFTRTIEPIISSIVDEIDRKFISKTARSQKQKIMFFRDPFKLIPISQIAEIADKFTRNEILSSNEVRQIVGRKPSDDPKADQLINSNISQSKETMEKINGKTSDEDSDEINDEETNSSIVKEMIRDSKQKREEIQNGL